MTWIWTSLLKRLRATLERTSPTSAGVCCRFYSYGGVFFIVRQFFLNYTFMCRLAPPGFFSNSKPYDFSQSLQLNTSLEHLSLGPFQRSYARNDRHFMLLKSFLLISGQRCFVACCLVIKAQSPSVLIEHQQYKIYICIKRERQKHKVKIFFNKDTPPQPGGKNNQTESKHT